MLELLIKWKPDWLYEAMPLIYFVAGLAAIFYFDTPLGIGAGALFIFVTFLILMMRQQSRIIERNK